MGNITQLTREERKRAIYENKAKMFGKRVVERKPDELFIEQFALVNSHFLNEHRDIMRTEKAIKCRLVSNKNLLGADEVWKKAVLAD